MWFRNSLIVGVFVKVKLCVNGSLYKVCRASVYYVGVPTDSFKHIYVLYITIKIIVISILPTFSFF